MSARPAGRAPGCAGRSQHRCGRPTVEAGPVSAADSGSWPPDRRAGRSLGLRGGVRVAVPASMLEVPGVLSTQAPPEVPDRSRRVRPSDHVGGSPPRRLRLQPRRVPSDAHPSVRPRARARDDEQSSRPVREAAPPRHGRRPGDALLAAAAAPRCRRGLAGQTSRRARSPPQSRPPRTRTDRGQPLGPPQGSDRRRQLPAWDQRISRDPGRQPAQDKGLDPFGSGLVGGR
jgi:hypothetical protein